MNKLLMNDKRMNMKINLSIKDRELITKEIIDNKTFIIIIIHMPMDNHYNMDNNVSLIKFNNNKYKINFKIKSSRL